MMILRPICYGFSAARRLILVGMGRESAAGWLPMAIAMGWRPEALGSLNEWNCSGDIMYEGLSLQCCCGVIPVLSRSQVVFGLREI